MSLAAPLVLLGSGLAFMPPPRVLGPRLMWLARNRFPNPALPHDQRSARWAGRVRVTRRWVGPAVAVIGIGGFLALGPVAGTLAAVLAAFAGRAWSHRRVRQHAQALRSDLSRAIGALTDEQTAGATIPAALARAATVAGRLEADFHQAGQAAARGADPVEYWPPVAELTSLSERAYLAVACSVAGRAGVRLTEVLTALRADLEADRTVRRAVAETLAGPRSSAALLAILPVVGVLMGMAMGARPLTVLLHTAPGLIVLTTGCGLNLAGLLWSSWLSRRAQP